MHDWPYDPRDYDDVLPALGAAGCRIIVPYLRGFGATRFLSTGTPRSGQQAALGNDLRELMDALSAQRAVLVGYDWGGRAACIVSALWPERVRGLVTGNSYNIQDIPNSGTPASPEQEHRLWYQYYFSTERGRAGLEANRKAFCRMLWKLWSPHWAFERSARSFYNPDFVAVTIQSYRHHYGYAPGDPAVEAIEQRLAPQPQIAVPTIALQGEADGVHPLQASAHHGKFFAGPFERRKGRRGRNSRITPRHAPLIFVTALGPVQQYYAMLIADRYCSRHADAMGREPAEQKALDPFPSAESPAAGTTTESGPRRYVLPKNLPNAVKHLTDGELDLMHAATLEELRRRGRTPKSVEIDLPVPADLTKIQSPPIKTAKLNAAEVSLTRGQLNAVRSAVKQALRHRELPGSSVFLYRMCGRLWRRIKRSGESYDNQRTSCELERQHKALVARTPFRPDR